MKHFIYLLLTVLLLASCGGNKAKLSSGSTSLDSASYAIGILEGSYMRDVLKQMGVDVVEEHLYQGMADALLWKDTITKLDKQWADQMLNRYVTGLKKEKSRVFLEKNAKKDSVKVLASGLQYKVLVEGTGISPEVSDTINVKYKGSLVSGDVFEERVEPIKIPLQMMIQGWKEGIPLMKEGAKYAFYIPADLAYGDFGRMAGETLIFEVELVSVIKGKSAE
ncbi:MAG: FKBP-type peptidyl-prolyl cis-trans isomerase [Prevotellaceae bacterium]|jgi:FKBP-type peptidyl-prolyl cis-trans isomerase|nr:FKBP-type peptidyl-prolyl cis-trans isomerase [Prevotellaceae bacterium]